MKTNKKFFFKELKKWLIFNAFPLIFIFAFFRRELVHNFYDLFSIGSVGILLFTIPLYFLENLEFKNFFRWIFCGIIAPTILFFLFFRDFSKAINYSYVTNTITYFIFSFTLNNILDMISQIKKGSIKTFIYFTVALTLLFTFQYFRFKDYFNR